MKKRNETLDRAFDAHLDVNEDGCWNWLGTMARGTVPMLVSRSKAGYFCVSARRYAYLRCNLRLEKDDSEIRNSCGNIRCVNPQHNTENTFENRFWAKVDIRSDDECWMWTGSGDKGYGNFEDTKAHRVSYKLTYGDFLQELDVLHKCDVPLCVNPRHLFLGSHTDNMRDMVEKGRSRRGEESGRHKLTESDVLTIREKLQNGESIRSICSEFGVGKNAIDSIKTGRTWGWL